MQYAADLHLHSRYSAAVSKDMTVENIALWARRKGIDVMGTGDCLQAEWLAELEAALIPAEPGWFSLRDEIDRPIVAALPGHLQKALRFVLSTEVSCAPPPGGALRGIHHLIYFPSFAKAGSFRRKLEVYGDLCEGRPEVRLTSCQLLELVCEHGEDCHMAPAHVMNPYFSSLGTREGHTNLQELFGDLQPHLLAVETGLTSIPPMCRRMSSLDGHALFSCSDAHSLDNLGRECTLLETEPGYDEMFAALREGGRERLRGLIKFPLGLTRYFLNYCSRCKEPFEGTLCPMCKGALVMGSRDRLEKIADQEEDSSLRVFFRTLLPLKILLGRINGQSPKSQRVTVAYDDLIRRVGNERHILTRAGREEFPDASARVVEAIFDQREVGCRSAEISQLASPRISEQMSLLN